MSTSTSEEDVLRIKKKLEKMIKSNEIDVNLSIDMLNLALLGKFRRRDSALSFSKVQLFIRTRLFLYVLNYCNLQ